MTAAPIRGFPSALQDRVLGADESYWTGLRVLFDNGLFLRLEGGGKTMGNYWTFGTFLSAQGNRLKPTYADVERWLAEHRSYHARAYLSPRKTDPGTRSRLDSLADEFGGSYVALMLMERKPELVMTPADVRWTIDARFFARGRVENTTPGIARILDTLADSLAACSTGCFAAKIQGSRA